MSLQPDQQVSPLTSKAAPTLPNTGCAPETLIVRPDIMHRLDFPRLFGRNAPVEIELGAGDGAFILEYAARNPDINLLAVERLMGRLRKIDRKGRRRELSGIRAIRIEAAYLLQWMIPPKSIQAIHIYFPDPWPKRRHWKNRLVQQGFPELCRMALMPGGAVHVRTDDAPYFEWILNMFESEKDRSLLERRPSPEPLLAIHTDFENEFQRIGKPTLSASWYLTGSSTLDNTEEK